MLASLLPGCADEPRPRENPPPQTGPGERAFAHLYEGACREHEDDAQGALLSFEKAYAENPDSSTLCRTLARAYVGAKRLEDALALLRRHALGGRRGADECRLAVVLLLDRQNRPADAEKEAQTLRRDARSTRRVFRALWRRYLAIGRPREAALCLLEAAGRSPASPALFHEAGAAFLHLGFDALAVDAFRKGLAQTPADLALRHGLAGALERRGLRQEALGVLLEILDTVPGDGRAALRAADLTAGTGDLQGAAEILRRADRTGPPRADILRDLGRILMRQGKHAEAAAAFSVALTLADEPSGLLDLAMALEEAGQPRRAEAPALAALANGGDGRVRHFLAYLWAAYGKTDPRARAFADEALKNNPNVPIVLATAGLLRSRAGLFNEAQALFRKALAGEQDPYVCWLYSLHHGLQGDEKAEAEWRKKAASLAQGFCAKRKTAKNQGK